MDWRIPALGVLAFAVYSLRPTAKHPPYPPGPPGELLIGNLRSMPLKDEEIYFTELGKEYGDIIHMDLLGRHLVVLNSLSTAIDLMDKRSAIYSGRPRLPLTEILGVDKTLVFTSIGTNLFRLHRRLIQRYLMKETVVTHDYRSSWVRTSRALARRLLEKPEEWEESMVHFSTAVTIEVTVGHQITSDDDEYNRLAKNICDYAIPTLKPPEGSLVDLFPFLKHLPGWIPGNYWVGKARFARQFVQEFRNYPVEDTIERMAKGSARPSFLVKQLEDMQNGTADPNMDMEDIKGLIVTMFSGGAETTSSSLSIFLAALFLHPECQRKAQEEIDRVVGRSRLPDFSDRENLPYITGLMHEASRWRPVLPLGVPRTTMADDVYNGMFIPKDTIVMANVKAMGLDEKVYKDPETFDPSRYLPAPEGRGEPPLSSAFGFGRRICPGRFLADDTLWIAVATLLATMSVSKPVDADGKEYMPDIKWAPGITSHPLPFPCRIQARTPEIKRLLSLD